MHIRIGLTLMLLGVVLFGGWKVWTRTRRIDPVDMPLTVAAGPIATRNFLLNYDGHYLIEITAEKTAPAEAGLANLGAEWSVWSGGREVSRGTTEEVHSAPGKSAELTRVIGEFNGRAGQSYELRVRFTKDAPELQMARLRVVVSGLAKENLSASSVLLFSIVFICQFFGLILVGVGIWGRIRVPPGVGTS